MNNGNDYSRSNNNDTDKDEHEQQLQIDNQQRQHNDLESADTLQLIHRNTLLRVMNTKFTMKMIEYKPFIVFKNQKIPTIYTKWFFKEMSKLWNNNINKQDNITSDKKMLKLQVDNINTQGDISLLYQIDKNISHHFAIMLTATEHKYKNEYNVIQGQLPLVCRM